MKWFWIFQSNYLPFLSWCLFFKAACCWDRRMSPLTLWPSSVACLSSLPCDIPDFKVTVIFILYCFMWFETYMTHWNIWSFLIVWNSHKTNEDNYLMTYNLFICCCNVIVSMSERQNRRKYVIVGSVEAVNVLIFSLPLSRISVMCQLYSWSWRQVFKIQSMIVWKPTPPQLCFMWPLVLLECYLHYEACFCGWSFIFKNVRVSRGNQSNLEPACWVICVFWKAILK